MSLHLLILLLGIVAFHWILHLLKYYGRRRPRLLCYSFPLLLLFYGLLSFLLSISCTEPTEEATLTVPLHIRAQVDETATRSVDKQSFESNDILGILTDTANEPYTYDGTAWSGHYYFEHNTVTLSAYYPYDDEAYQNNSALEAKDYLFRRTTLEVTDQPVALTLSHVMSKLAFRFVLGEGYDASTDITDAVESLQIHGIVPTGSFNPTTGEAAASTTSTAATVACEGVEAILFPQTAGITLTFTYKGTNYITPAFQVNLKTGKAYTYTVTLNKTQITVTNVTINDWGNTKKPSSGTANPTAKYSFGSIAYAAQGEVHRYALAFTDGSYENLDDDEGTFSEEKLNALTAFQLSQVAGVVYYTSDVTADDAALKRDYPGCTHGLICALDNATTDRYIYNNIPSRMYWQYGYEGIYDVISSGDFTLPSYLVYNDISESSKVTKVMGYNNTEVLKRYNNDYCPVAHPNPTTDDKYGLVDYVVRPVYAVEHYQGLTVAGATPWFLPSAKELLALYNCSEQIETIAKKIVASTGRTDVVQTFIREGISSNYWSSTEKNATYIWYVDFSKKGVLSEGDRTVSSTGTSNAYQVRPVCAF